MDESKKKKVPLLFTPKNRKTKRVEIDVEDEGDPMQMWKIFKDG